ncbi:MAG TPA: sensor histidine kinase [Gemmatimonadaceae bacterium]|nr:sensor histidine kinase [Gemmatimonadaceae bacterium]
MSTRRSNLVWWIAGFGISTAFAFLNVAEGIVRLTYANQPINMTRLVTMSLADWYTCAIFFPLFVYAIRRWPLDWQRLGTRLPLHLALTLGAVVAKYALYLPLRARLTGFEQPFVQGVAVSAISEAIAFGCVAAVLHAIEFYRRYRERETYSLQLQARLSDAQLRALRAQLNPHFLFNTLNAATTLLHRDPDGADAMLTRLGELLRLTLRAAPEHETTLREEVALLDRYLAIMQIRFSDRVTVRCSIDPRVADALVPSFVLQPIVENAFEHGVARLQRPGHIDIAAEPAEDALVLTVRDNGGGVSASDEGSGVGLANTRRRLAELYAADAELSLTSTPADGTMVEVRLPLRFEAQPLMASA